MSHIETFSTAGLAPQRRLEYWNHLAGNEITQLVADPLDVHSFAGELTRAHLGRVRVASVLSAPATVRRAQHHIADSREEQYFLCVQIAGRTLVRQLGRQAMLGQGDFTLLDSQRPFELRFTATNRMLVLCIPHDELGWRRVEPESVVGLAMSTAGAGLAALASTSLVGLWRQIHTQPETRLAPRIGTALLDVVSCAYEAAFPYESRVRASAVRRREHVLRYVEAHLDDPQLSPNAIARATHMSPRYLHHLFTERRESVARYVLRRRLEMCSRELGNPAQCAETIIDIALRHGFSDASHFGRAFRAHFGLTPSAYRLRETRKPT